MALSFRDFGFESYADYLSSEPWRLRREAFFATHERSCFVCAATSVDLHHRTYKRVCRELDDDLVALCRMHHFMTHALERTEGDLFTAHERVKASDTWPRISVVVPPQAIEKLHRASVSRFAKVKSPRLTNRQKGILDALDAIENGEEIPVHVGRKLIRELNLGKKPEIARPHIHSGNGVGLTRVGERKSL